MHKLSESWALTVGVILQFFTAVNNETLSGIVNILTIVVLMTGLIDYFVRKVKAHRRETQGADTPEQGKKTEGKRKERARRFSKAVRKAHKSFRTLDLLENPESAGN